MSFSPIFLLSLTTIIIKFYFPLLLQSYVYLDVFHVKKNWIEKSPLSLHRQAKHLLCDDAQLKYCFESQYCYRLLPDNFSCKVNFSEKSIKLGVSNGRDEFCFSYYPDDDNTSHLTDSTSYIYDNEFIAKF